MTTNFVKGFTLVEMMVTVSIASLIMVTVFFNYGVFTDDLALSSAAQEMAIAVRQTQTYGLTVKEVAVGGGQFSSGYGIYFDVNDSSNYYLFADTNADKKYSVGSGCGSGSTECIEKFSLRNGVTITNICNSTTCPPTNASRVSVTFLRPNPDAYICFTDNANGSISCPSGDGKAKVVLTSKKGAVTTVIIDSTGQILIQKS